MIAAKTKIIISRVKTESAFVILNILFAAGQFSSENILLNILVVPYIFTEKHVKTFLYITNYKPIGDFLYTTRSANKRTVAYRRL